MSKIERGTPHMGVKTREPGRTRVNIGYFFMQPVLSPVLSVL